MCLQSLLTLYLGLAITRENAIAMENLFADARAIGLRANHFVGRAEKIPIPGIQRLPWATIFTAAGTATAGDTVAIRGGRYLLAFASART